MNKANTKEKSAITPTREEDYPEWYQQAIKAADMAENAPVRGCMIIKPWGYGIWENIQRILDEKIKATGHENAYFPLLSPSVFLKKKHRMSKDLQKSVLLSPTIGLKKETANLSLWVNSKSH